MNPGSTQDDSGPGQTPAEGATAESGVAQPRLTITGLTKTFGSNVACEDISVTVRRGTIHAVVGENGAGKTTMMRCVAGLVQPDSGELRFDGTARIVDSVETAMSLSVGMVHQELSVVDDLTLAENLILGVEPTRRGRLDRDAITATTAELDERTGWALPWDSQASEVGVADLGRFELVRQIHRGADLLILDEPTAVLGPVEVDQLLGTMRDLRDSGHTLIFITHKLAEVMAVSDDVTVLKGGRQIWSGPSSDTSPEELAHRMVGAVDAVDIEPSITHDPNSTARTILDVRHLTVTDHRLTRHLDDVDFTVNSGEIVGVYGVAGSGQRPLVEALLGLRPATGSIQLHDEEVSGLDTAARRAAGLSYISPDRRAEGLAVAESILDNVVAGEHKAPGFATRGVLTMAHWRERLDHVISEYGVKAAGPDTPAGSLSGGNQQRLIVGRELQAKPTVLVASDPTRGVDILGVADIHNFLVRLRDEGAGVVLVSHELDEVLALSDRVVVLLAGRAVAILDRHEATREAIAERMTLGEAA